jgi:hypothetical protein
MHRKSSRTSKDVFFQTLDAIFSPLSSDKPLINLQVLFAIFSETIVLGQTWRIMWAQNFHSSDWQHYEGIWQTISYASPDTIFAEINHLSSFILILLVELSFCTCLILWELFVTYSRKQRTNAIRKLIVLLLAVNCELLFIPSAITFMLMIKYSIIQNAQISEYANSPPTSSILISNSSQTLGLIGLGLVLFLEALNIGFGFEMSHSRTASTINAKISPQTDFVRKTVQLVLAALYVIGSGNSYLTYLVVSTWLFCGVIYWFIKELPYYLTEMNIIKVFFTGESLLISVSYIIGYLTNTSTATLLLFLCLQPACYIFSRSAIAKRTEKSATVNIESASDLEFELFYRADFINKQQIEDFFTIADNHHKKIPSSTIGIFEAYYAGDILNEPMLGLIKALCIKTSALGIFTQFQLFKCKRSYVKSSKSCSSFKTVYLNRFLLFLGRKEGKLNKYLNSISLEYSNHFNPDNLKKFVIKINKTKCWICNRYEKILRNYSDHQIINQMYGTFLRDVIGNSEMAQEFLIKGKFNNIGQGRGTISLNGIDAFSMILDADSKNFGKIICAGQQICQLLEIKDINELTHDFLEFFPKSIRKSVKETLTKGFALSETTTFFADTEFPLMSANGHLTECNISIECIGFKHEVFYILWIQPLEKLRATLLINNDGIIEAHNEELNKYSQRTLGSFLGQTVDQALKLRNFSGEMLQENCIFQVEQIGINSHVISMNFVKKQIGNSFVKLIYINHEDNKDFANERRFSLHARTIGASRHSILEGIKLSNLKFPSESSEEKKNEEIESSLLKETIKKVKFQLQKKQQSFFCIRSLKGLTILLVCDI